MLGEKWIIGGYRLGFVSCAVFNCDFCFYSFAARKKKKKACLRAYYFDGGILYAMMSCVLVME